MLAPRGRPESMLIASEPLTTETSTWLELPEYSLLRVCRDGDGLRHETTALDV
jgi:predicted glutamine amidotransferase